MVHHKVLSQLSSARTAKNRFGKGFCPPWLEAGSAGEEEERADVTSESGRPKQPERAVASYESL